MRLMGLFVEALDSEIDELQRNGVRLRFIGERDRHSRCDLQTRIAAAEAAHREQYRTEAAGRR